MASSTGDPAAEIAAGVRLVVDGTAEWMSLDDEIHLRRPEGGGPSELEAEAWSWAWLTGDEQVPATGQARLVELGWRQATEPQPNLQYVGNYLRRWDTSAEGAADAIATELVTIVREVYNPYWARDKSDDAKAKFLESWKPKVRVSGQKGGGCLGGAAVASLIVATVVSFSWL